MGRDHEDRPQARQRRTRRKFSEEFKHDAVELVRSSGLVRSSCKPVAQVARELGIYGHRA